MVVVVVEVKTVVVVLVEEVVDIEELEEFVPSCCPGHTGSGGPGRGHWRSPQSRGAGLSPGDSTR